MGTTVYVAVLYWIVPTFLAAEQSLFLAIPALVALSAYMGLYWGGWSWLLNRFAQQKPHALLLALFGAAAWVTLEWVRSWLFTGFPWAMLSDTQVYFPMIIQIASLTGAYGVSFLIVLGNFSIVLLFMKQDALTPRLLWSTLVGCALWGQLQLIGTSGLPSASMLTVSVLQGNVDQYKKWNDTFVEDIKTSYANLVRLAAETRAQVIVWPETSVPGFLLEDPTLRSWLTRTIANTQATHIVGTPTASGENIFNSAIAVLPTGQVTEQYDKQHLVPFGEAVPFQSYLGRWIPVLNALGGFTPGTASPILHAAGVPLGVSICYEAIFPNLVRQSVAQGAAVLVNITNDGWYLKTTAPYQHLAPNIFRAVENRRWMVRANNTGVSAFIDPYGRLQAQTSIYVTEAMTRSVTPRTDVTFYSRYGDVFVGFCVLTIVALGFGVRRARITP